MDVTLELAGYRLAARLARALLPLGGWFWPKLALGIAGRRASAAGFLAHGRARSAAAPPTLVLHAASAGELRQLEPVYRRVRARWPGWSIVVTYFSPSAVPVAESLGPDLHGFLPWDSPADVARFLDALRPSAIVTCKLDLWPELTFGAHARGIRQAIIAATVRPSSGRLRAPVRGALAPAYRRLDRVGAVSDADAGRLVRLGAVPDRVVVLGDPRYDAVLERIAGSPPPPVQRPLLVAGSTWPADEDRLLQAFARVRAKRPEAGLLLVPHEPSPRDLDRLAARAAALDLPAPSPLDADDEAITLRVETRVGRLALLYGRGGLAYVGGGFGRAGLHSVLEPAAWGRPVLAGAGWTESRDARLLFEAGGLRPAGGADPVSELAAGWLAWLEDDGGRRRAGTAALGVVRAGLGAADRSADLVGALMAPGG